MLIQSLLQPIRAILFFSSIKMIETKKGFFVCFRRVTTWMKNTQKKWATLLVAFHQRSVNYRVICIRHQPGAGTFFATKSMQTQTSTSAIMGLFVYWMVRMMNKQPIENDQTRRLDWPRVRLALTCNCKLLLSFTSLEPNAIALPAMTNDDGVSQVYVRLIAIVFNVLSTLYRSGCAWCEGLIIEFRNLSTMT